jgi:hypothetical protein
MSKTKISQFKELTENLKPVEEYDEVAWSDADIDDYFTEKNRLIDGVFDHQNDSLSAVEWRRRKLADYAFLLQRGKLQNSLRAKKMFESDNTAKELVELWCSKYCHASDIENYLKKNPIDSAQYLIAILDHFEMNGISKGVKTVRTGIAKSGAKAKSEKSKKGVAMNKAKEHFFEWQKTPSQFKYTSYFHFASVMQKRFLDADGEPILASPKQISENCKDWKNEMNTENFSRAA